MSTMQIDADHTPVMLQLTGGGSYQQQAEQEARHAEEGEGGYGGGGGCHHWCVCDCSPFPDCLSSLRV